MAKGCQKTDDSTRVRFKKVSSGSSRKMKDGLWCQQQGHIAAKCPSNATLYCRR